MHIVCPNIWMADCASSSGLMGSWPIAVIPYPINLWVWSPCDQTRARTLLCLPLDRTLLLFSATDGRVITMTPNGGETGVRRGELFLQLKIFAKAQGLCTAFDSSTGFRLANCSVRSPDASLVRVDC